MIFSSKRESICLSWNKISNFKRVLRSSNSLRRLPRLSNSGSGKMTKSISLSPLLSPLAREPKRIILSTAYFCPMFWILSTSLLSKFTLTIPYT
ncbi:hypothetical protein DSY0394 [Desulfitobacterium hafniense Y51]|uniref:Uncharacterized protein n=1 Tax=Desulfitobacterium hafniense (strain Y51) TaxID=138119 RepID=Q250V9_DESHY|nr:hypothetical protein DSY0394 [Desulfitobacterium hafniense Y51]